MDKGRSNSSMKIILQNVPQDSGDRAHFGKSVEEVTVSQRDGFSTARHLAHQCMRWIWVQWLVSASSAELQRNVSLFVERGMQMQKRYSVQHMRCLHDLFLIHCAVFASNDAQLFALARHVVDASGVDGIAPKNDGELYAAAWCGMLKHWILGDAAEAERQYNLIWGAYRPPYFRTTTKPLVSKWFSGDWKSFVSLQQADFERMWDKARKDNVARTVSTEEVLVDLRMFDAAQSWCWAHCGIAMLAYRRGNRVATDPLWFPPTALTHVTTTG